jgi:prolyl oligopeptidase
MAPVEPVTELIHGVSIVDPYRWLEDGQLPATQKWIDQQTAFAREYLNGIPRRTEIEERIRQFLEVDTYDSVLIAQGKYFFRKRLAKQEQSSIYVREGIHGSDRLLVNPRASTSTDFGSVRPLAISRNGTVLAYELREGGERTSRVEFVNVDSGKQLPERLPHGYLKAFAFASDSQSFYYSIDPSQKSGPSPQVLYQHWFGESLENDRLVFHSGALEKTRFGLISGPHLQFIVLQEDRLGSDYLLRTHGDTDSPKLAFSSASTLLAPQFAGDRIFALTDQHAPNLRIVEVKLRKDGTADFSEVVCTRSAMIQQWLLLHNFIVVCYLKELCYQLCVFDFHGNQIADIALPPNNTVRLVAGSTDTDEFFFERQSFFESPSLHHYCVATREQTAFTQAAHSLDHTLYTQEQVWYQAKDGTSIPLFIVGRNDLLENGNRCPVVLTAYGGFQISMTPQFSVFVSFLLEKECLFALPGIRGGGEFGVEWHRAAQGRNRQTSFDDFLSAAQWLIDNEFADPGRIAIFGGSNSGILMGVAITQAPNLFCALVCVGPLLDMVRYHLFDTANKWKDEYGTPEDPDEFAALLRYSPYHRIADGVSYPAVMMISGALDQQCNPLHARKMVARLQAASSSSRPIIFDYHPYRGHSPVLPLTMRIAALVDRMAFLCDQLKLT